MGLLQVHSDGVKLEEGESEFLFPVYAEEIHSREVIKTGIHTFLAPLLTFFLTLLSSLPPVFLPFLSSKIILRLLFAQPNSLAIILSH